MGRRRKTYAGATLKLTQIEAADRIYERLKDWKRPIAALEMLDTELPSFDTSTTLLKTTLVNAERQTRNFRNGLVGDPHGETLPVKASERRKVSRVSLVLAHDSTAARTNTGAETHVSRARTSVSC